MADSTTAAAANTARPNRFAVNLIKRFQQEGNLMKFLARTTSTAIKRYSSALVEVVGEDPAQFIHREIGQLMQTENYDIITLFKCAKVLAALDGGTGLALDVLRQFGYEDFGYKDGNYATSHNFFCYAKAHDDATREVCENLVEAAVAAPSNEETPKKLKEVIDTVRVARQGFEEFQDEVAFGLKLRSNPHYFQTMIYLAEGHTRRTADVVVRKVVDGRNIPEELIAMICDCYVEDDASMKRVKENWGHDRAQFGCD